MVRNRLPFPTSMRPLNVKLYMDLYVYMYIGKYVCVYETQHRFIKRYFWMLGKKSHNCIFTVTCIYYIYV